MKYLSKTTAIVIYNFCMILILAAACLIAAYCYSYRQSDLFYEDIQSQGIVSSELPEENVPSVSPETPYPAVDFAALRQINPDLVGWISIPDTRINYPIVKRENDNKYYLSHLFDGTVNRSGCIFVDARCSLESEHILIHGHNMANGSMFRDLRQFRSRDFLDSHPFFWILTPEKAYQVQIFACGVVGLDSPVWQLDFPTSGAKLTWLTSCQNVAWLRTDIMPAADDRIVTLSTCSYEFDQARWIVQGVLTEFTESPQGLTSWNDF